MIALSKVSFLLAIVILGIIFSCQESWNTSLTMISSSVSLHSRLRASLKSNWSFGSNFLAALGSAGGDEAEVVEERLLHPALTTLVIRFEASAILILWPPALQASSTPTERRVGGQ